MNNSNEQDPPGSQEKKQVPGNPKLKEHSYDGIQEYDQQLPRWWLITLFGAIAFSACYWLILDVKAYEGRDHAGLETRLGEIETRKLASSIDVTDNQKFWEMSGNPTFVSAGKTIYNANCVPCHGNNLEGGIGFNLVDAEWVHGSAPADIYAVIEHGVPEKGMQPWGNLLGQKRISEVVAYILSKNDRAAMEAPPSL